MLEHKHVACVPGGHFARFLRFSGAELCWAHRLEVYVPPDLRLSYAAATICVAYDEVTAQAQRLADDRDRDPCHPLHFLLCEDAGLRCDGAWRGWPDLRPQADPSGD